MWGISYRGVRLHRYTPSFLGRYDMQTNPECIYGLIFRYSTAIVSPLPVFSVLVQSASVPPRGSGFRVVVAFPR